MFLINQILIVNYHNRVIYNIKNKYKRNHISIKNRKDELKLNKAKQERIRKEQEAKLAAAKETGGNQ